MPVTLERRLAPNIHEVVQTVPQRGHFGWLSVYSCVTLQPRDWQSHELSPAQGKPIGGVATKHKRDEFCILRVAGSTHEGMILAIYLQLDRTRKRKLAPDNRIAFTIEQLFG